MIQRGSLRCEVRWAWRVEVVGRAELRRIDGSGKSVAAFLYLQGYTSDWSYCKHDRQDQHPSSVDHRRCIARVLPPGRLSRASNSNLSFQATYDGSRRTRHHLSFLSTLLALSLVLQHPYTSSFGIRTLRVPGAVSITVWSLVMPLIITPLTVRRPQRAGDASAVRLYGRRNGRNACQIPAEKLFGQLGRWGTYVQLRAPNSS